MKRKKNRSLCSTYLPSIIVSASTLLLSLSTPPLPRFRRPFFIRVAPRFLRFPSFSFSCLSLLNSRSIAVCPTSVHVCRMDRNF